MFYLYWLENLEVTSNVFYLLKNWRQPLAFSPIKNWYHYDYASKHAKNIYVLPLASRQKLYQPLR